LQRMKRLYILSLMLLYLSTTSVFACPLNCKSFCSQASSADVQVNRATNTTSCHHTTAHLPGCHKCNHSQSVTCHCIQGHVMEKPDLMLSSGSSLLLSGPAEFPLTYLPGFSADPSAFIVSRSQATGPPPQKHLPIYLVVRAMLI